MDCRFVPCHLNTGLWSACGVICPDFCNDSTLIPGSVTKSGNCSDFSVLTKQIYCQIYCNAEIYNSYQDVHRQYEYPEDINMCRVTGNDEMCAVITLNPNVMSYLRAVQSDCLLNLMQGCIHSCQTALDYLKSTVGCCMTVYSPSSTNPAFWLACGLPFPVAELCPSTLLSTNQYLGPTASSSVYNHSCNLII